MLSMYALENADQDQLHVTLWTFGKFVVRQGITHGTMLLVAKFVEMFTAVTRSSQV